MLTQHTSAVLKRHMLALFLALCAVALLLGLDWNALAAGVVALAVVFLLFPPLCQVLERMGPVRLWLVLTGLCLLLKGLWVWWMRVPLSGDSYVFWSYADQLVQEETLRYGRYMALFPHIYGYASFLSGWFRLLGPLERLPQVLNVVLSACSGSLLFLLLRQDLRRAAAAYLLWIVCPSQTMYNALILSEPLYTAVLLLFLLLVAEFCRRAEGLAHPVWAGLALGAAGGALLRWLNMLRPIAPIPIAALLLCVLFLSGRSLRKHAPRRGWLAFLAALLLIYAALGPLIEARLTRRIGEAPADTPGYNVLVGFNQGSEGRWNQEDSDRLVFYSTQPGSTAREAQEQMLGEAMTRLTSGLNFPKLFQDKLTVFLGSDDACVGYCSPPLWHVAEARLLCNSFWVLLLLLALIGGARLWRRRADITLLMAALYTLGLTLAHLLAEVAGRYHYSMLPMLLLVGAWGLFPGADMEEKERNEPYG